MSRYVCLFQKSCSALFCCYEFDVGYKDVGQGPLGVFRGVGAGAMITFLIVRS